MDGGHEVKPANVLRTASAIPLHVVILGTLPKSFYPRLYILAKRLYFKF